MDGLENSKDLYLLIRDLKRVYSLSESSEPPEMLELGAGILL